MNHSSDKNKKPILPATGELLVKDSDQNMVMPGQLDLVPMLELNIFPQLLYPISIEDDRAKQAVHRSLDSGRPLALFMVRDGTENFDDLTIDDFHSVGVAAVVHKAWETEKGYLRVVVQGLTRIRLSNVCLGQPLLATVETAVEEEDDAESLRPLVLEVKRLFGQVTEMSPTLPFNPTQLTNGMDDKPGLMADLMVVALPFKQSIKTSFLVEVNVRARLMKLIECLTSEVANLETGQAISARIKNNMDKNQRENQLREQLKAIEAELGVGGDGDDDDYNRLSERLKTKALPDEAREVAERELARLRKTSSQSSEYGVIRNYVELILDLPWNESTYDCHDLAQARQILERDHYGLEKVKKRIMEFLAVRKLTGGIKSPILCLVGPPGVGKTSLGRSVAEALGRELVRLSLGGVRDEAEIRGHRRTYVGALPGRFISGLKKVKSNNPVIVLDELDKMTHNAMGDPASALLEVLDPEQNQAFSDHYLEIPFDLSKALFILTANVLEHIPGPLRDRLEVVEVSGYTLEEKIEIARRHVFPRELERHGLTEADLTLSDGALRELLESHTREAGVRDMTRKFSAVCRARAVEMVEKAEIIERATKAKSAKTTKTTKTTKITETETTEETAVKTKLTATEVTDKAEAAAKTEPGKKRRPLKKGNLTSILGPPRYLKEARSSVPHKGVVTGLAWTAAGGEILFIEAVDMPGQGQVSLTGQMGEVMQESAKAAISFVRSRSEEWGLNPDWFKEHDLHLHLPQGAIPKDGPSAGVALTTAIVSLVRGLKVRPDLAMTGEISLRGLVLPVGGIKEKLLAAKRAGLSQVLIPYQNRCDLAEMPEKLLKGMEVIFIKTLDEALALALLVEEQEEQSVENLLLETGEMSEFRSSGILAIASLSPPAWENGPLSQA